MISIDDSISELYLSARPWRVLENNNIHTIRDLLKMIKEDHEDIYKFKDMGKKSYAEIMNRLVLFLLPAAEKYNDVAKIIINDIIPRD